MTKSSSAAFSRELLERMGSSATNPVRQSLHKNRFGHLLDSLTLMIAEHNLQVNDD